MRPLWTGSPRAVAEEACASLHEVSRFLSIEPYSRLLIYRDSLPQGIAPVAIRFTAPLVISRLVAALWHAALFAPCPSWRPFGIYNASTSHRVSLSSSTTRIYLSPCTYVCLHVPMPPYAPMPPFLVYLAQLYHNTVDYGSHLAYSSECFIYGATQICVHI
jgi:hypothetical protein